MSRSRTPTYSWYVQNPWMKKEFFFQVSFEKEVSEDLTNGLPVPYQEREDLLQEARVRFLESDKVFSESWFRTYRSWMKAVLNRLAIDWLRKAHLVIAGVRHRREVNVEINEEAMTASESDVTGPVENEFVMALVNDYFIQQPWFWREIFIRKLDGESSRSIGEELAEQGVTIENNRGERPINARDVDKIWKSILEHLKKLLCGDD